MFRSSNERQHLEYSIHEKNIMRTFASYADEFDCRSIRSSEFDYSACSLDME